MEVLIAACGVTLMGLIAYRWIYRRPPIIPAISEAMNRPAPLPQPTSVWDAPFTGAFDWPRRGEPKRRD